MKNIICFLIVFVLISSNKSEAQTQDAKLTALLAINETQFVDKPLDSIMSILPSGETYTKIRGVRGTATYVVVLYPNRVWIELHVREFTHMAKYDSARV